jgi:hypothetical protein
MTRFCRTLLSFLSSLLLVVFIAHSCCLALSPTKNGNAFSENSSSCSSSARRSLFRTIVPTLLVVGSLNGNDASALEARNEMLCGTGFFTNIAQYKCTDIGDISDEGKAKKMNEQELGSMESLLGKMGVEDSVEDIQKEQKQKPGDKKKLASDDKP